MSSKLTSPLVTSADPGLVGREALLEQLQRALESGATRCVSLTGRPGIGKTAAALHLVDHLQAQGFQVLRVFCQPDMPPLGLWDQLRGRVSGVEALLRGREQQLSSAQRESPVARGVARFELFSHLTDQAMAPAEERRCALLVDNLQWADTDSFDLLMHMLRAEPDWRLVATSSSPPQDDGGSARSRVLSLQIDRATVVALEPLGGDDVDCYLERILGEPASRVWARALFERSGGNPLFLRELVQYLLHRGVDLCAVQPSVQLAGMLPPLLKELVKGRAHALSPTAQRILQAASVLEGEIEVRLLATMCDEDIGRTLVGLDELAQVSIVRPLERLPGHWQFVHELVRETFYETLPSTLRGTLHLRAGELLAGRTADSAGPALVRAATHLRKALPLSEPSEVVRICRAAARWTAAQGAYLDAARLHEHACELAEQYAVGSARDRLAQLMALGRAYLSSGQKDKTYRTYSQVIKLARSLRKPRLQLEAVLACSATLDWGRHPNKIEGHLFHEALTLASPASALRARLLSRQAVLQSHFAIGPAEVEMARAAVHAALPYRYSRDQRAWLEAQRALHFALQGQAHRRERGEVGLELLALENKLGISEHTYSVREILAGERLMHGDRSGHDRILAETSAPALQHPQFAWLHEVARASAELIAGQWDNAEAHMQRATQLGFLTKNPQAVHVAVGQRLLMRRLQGRLDELRTELAQLRGNLQWLGDYPQALHVALLAEMGDLEGSRRLYEPLVAGWLARPASNNDWLITAVELSWTCVRLGDRARSAALTEQLLPHADLHAVHPGVNYYAGPVARYLGLLSVLEGRPQEAVGWLTRAEHACLSIGAHAMGDIVLQDLRDIHRGAASAPAPAAQPMTAPSASASTVAGSTSPSATTGTEIPADEPDPRVRPALIRKGETWLVHYQGQEIYARDLLGLRYLAELLSRPHDSFRARTLVDGQVEQPTGMPTAVTAGRVHSGDTGDMVDRQALSAYRARLQGIDAELDEAQAHCDSGRIEKLVLEREALRQELSRVLDVFGRPRKTGSGDERARVSCTRAIRKAIRYFVEHLPPLGEHLQASVRTGHECSYRPAEDIAWECQI